MAKLEFINKLRITIRKVYRNTGRQLLNMAQSYIFMERKNQSEAPS
jgi:hypothetical protein